MTHVFIDIEASSMYAHSYPIEVGWCGEDGQGESYLIRPEGHWVDWSVSSESMHGISRGLLKREGKPAEWVARRVHAVLTRPGVVGISDAPGFDSAWLAELLAVGDLRAPRLRDVAGCYGAECSALFRSLGTERESLAAAQSIVAEAQDAEAMRHRRRHRALPDAEGLWWTWKEIRRRIAEHLGEV